MRKALLSLILLLVLFPLKGQLETAHWCFGSRAGVDFTSGSPVAVTNGALYTTEGCASISDNKGNLLFYTDGVTVYNREHQIMPNGTDLLGHPSSTQSAIIVPHPYQPNIYYLFTVHTIDSYPNGKGIHYSIVDMNLDTGRGDIVSTQKNIPLPLNGRQKSDEKITAVKHANGRDVWVITHYLNSFYAFLINTSGVMTTPVISTVGIIASSWFNGAAYMKGSPNGKKIGSAYFYGALVLYDFDNSTGVVSNEIILDKEYEEFYGVEFSPNSNILYSSYDYIYQYDLTAASIPNSKFILASSTKSSSALQLALDKKNYYKDNKYLSVINNPNIYGAGADYQYNAIYLKGRTSNFGLPSFIVSYFRDEDILVNTSSTSNKFCLSDKPLQFSLETSIALPYTIDWDFGDGTPVINTFEPFHQYLNPGDYIVTATVHHTGGSDIFIKEVTMLAKPKVDLGADITTCDAKPIVLDAANAESTYLWSTGATTQTIAVSASGIYSVEVTNAAGCIGSDEVEVTFNADFLVDLGADITTCDTKPIVLDAANAGSTYLWSTGATTQTIEVSASGIYSVEVTNAAGCISTDEIEITFDTNLLVDLGADITTCDAKPIVLDAANAGSAYLWSTGATTQTIEVSASGIYSVEVTSTAGCISTDEIEITFNPELVVDLGADITTCDAKPIVLDAGNAGSTYLWNTGATTQTIEVSTSGIYSVEVTNAAGCIGSDEIEITFNSELVVDLGTDITTCDTKPIVLDAANAGSTYLWSTGATTQTIAVTTSGIYSVEVTNVAGCISTDEVEVTFNPELVVDLGADITTCDTKPIVLDAANAGSTYLWSTGATTQTIAVSASGIYSIEVTNAAGCISTDEIEITFNSELVVDLGADITTCDTKPIVLDAANAGSTYLWNTGATTQTIEVSTSGIYSVEVTNATGCTVTDDINVTFLPRPIVDLGEDINTCDDTAELDSSYSPLDATIVWTLPDGTTQRGTQTLEAMQSGKYTVSITKGGCTVTDEINVALSLIPYVVEVKTEGNSAEVIAKGDRPLEYSLDAIRWQNSPRFTGLDFGIHTAYVRDVYGCISEGFDFGLLNIPNIITPNGDGKNDAWDLKGLELYPGSKIQIFDRYGKILVNTVFTQNPVWDGKYLNNSVASATYWYIIELTDGRKLNGAITVKNY